jgi:hypothetical protein
MGWLPQVALAIIALCGCWIATQQMLIARQKLNHDLFDRRFKVFLATRDYMAAVLGRDKDVICRAATYHIAIAPAPFLFNADITDFVQEVEKRGNAAIISSASLTRTTTYEKRHEHATTLSQSLDWLQQEVDNDKLTQRFQSDLNLFRLTPLAINTILPTPNLRRVKRKVVEVFKLHGS